MGKFKCPDEDYALLQRLRNDLTSLKAFLESKCVKTREEEFWPEEAEELSDHELMMEILNALKGGSMKFDEIRDLLPTRTKPKYILWRKTIKPARRYVRRRLKKLVKKGFLQKTGRNEYKPIEKEEYFRRILGDLLEKEGYRVLESLK